MRVTRYQVQFGELQVQVSVLYVPVTGEHAANSFSSSPDALVSGLSYYLIIQDCKKRSAAQASASPAAGRLAAIINCPPIKSEYCQIAANAKSDSAYPGRIALLPVNLFKRLTFAGSKLRFSYFRPGFTHTDKAFMRKIKGVTVKRCLVSFF